MANFSKSTVEDIVSVAGEAGIDPAALLAVCEVESAGRAFAKVGDRREPVIRFEGHYFDRLLPADARPRARKLGLASPKFGVVKNPRSQSGRWAMLAKARAIDEAAALQSCSWGIGQVMGSHWKALGYGSPQELVREARSGVKGQVRLMVRFIGKNGLEPVLKRRDWATFAHRYNGPAYRKNRYDQKMASAYARHARGFGAYNPHRTAPSSWLRRGSRGAAVQSLQRQLVAAGYPLNCDGVFGLKTQAALTRFQANAGISADGIYGPQSTGALESYLVQRGQRLGFIGKWFVSTHKWLPALRLLGRVFGWTR
ncbi:MAG: N-acetylmuramidase domain-containing protein [Pseudomonadota bacterium]